MCCQNHALHINVLPLSNFLIHKSFNLREIYIIIIIIIIIINSTEFFSIE